MRRIQEKTTKVYREYGEEERRRIRPKRALPVGLSPFVHRLRHSSLAYVQYSHSSFLDAEAKCFQHMSRYVSNTTLDRG